MIKNQGLLPDDQKTTPIFSAFLNRLGGFPTDTPLTSSLIQAFEIRAFQLGDELFSYITANPTQSSVQQEQNEQNWGGLYLISQGRVRLLGTDAVEGREVSTLVLEEGESFGTEKAFADIPSLSRAIAASDGQMVWMPLAKLQSWLEKLPQLREYLLSSALSRAMLVFLKTSTELRRLPIISLKQLLPYLVETEIPAGEALVQSADTGRFWLRRGEISQSEPVRVPTVGDSWGYPHPTPADWVAQTELLVYKFPVEHWDVLENINVSFESQRSAISKVASNNGNLSHQRAVITPTPRAKPISPTQRQNLPTPPSLTASSQPEQIEFPKPAKYRQGPRLWKRYPFIEQQSSSDCGATCLAMIGRYWGKPLGLNYLRNLAGVGRAGATLKNLAQAAESLGFQSRPVRASLSRLAEQKNPWIAHWQGDHYIVVYQVNKKRVLVADPAMGRRSLSHPEFLEGWTGYALLLDPTVQLATAPTEKNSLSRFWGLLWPYRTLLGQIILASILLQVFGLITPLFTQIILDRVVVNKSLMTLHVFAIGLVIFGVWQIGTSATRQYLLDYFANRLDVSFVSAFIRHTLMLPLKFFEMRQVGDIITRIQETRKIQTFLTRQAVSTWLDTIMMFVYVGLMLYYNWQLTVLVMALIPPIAILTVVASPVLRQLSREVFKESASQNSLVVEMMTGVATVKAAAAEQEVRWRWEDKLTSLVNVQFKAQNLSNGLQSVGGLINSLGSTALLWYGASLVIQDQLTIGQFVAFNMLIGKVIDPVLSLVSLWDEFQEILVSVERLNDVLYRRT